jgi:hypothetical protein
MYEFHVSNESALSDDSEINLCWGLYNERKGSGTDGSSWIEIECKSLVKLGRRENTDTLGQYFYMLSYLVFALTLASLRLWAAVSDFILVFTMPL